MYTAKYMNPFIHTFPAKFSNELAITMRCWCNKKQFMYSEIENLGNLIYRVNNYTWGSKISMRTALNEIIKLIGIFQYALKEYNLYDDLIKEYNIVSSIFELSDI